MIKKFTKRYIDLLSKIPERHYWPIFIFLSLYFVVPYSEFVVTALALLYFKFEQPFRKAFAKCTAFLPEWVRLGGSVIFFLVMLDDTLAYACIILLAFWSGRAVKKQKELDKDGDPSYTNTDVEE
jgi:hypothetical protein